MSACKLFVFCLILTKIVTYRQISETFINIKFHKGHFSSFRFVAYGQTDCQTRHDETNVRSFVNFRWERANGGNKFRHAFGWIVNISCTLYFSPMIRLSFRIRTKITETPLFTMQDAGGQYYMTIIYRTGSNGCIGKHPTCFKIITTSKLLGKWHLLKLNDENTLTN
jgi:hypothetical protein